MITIKGIDINGEPFDIFTEVSINGKVNNQRILTKKEMESADTVFDIGLKFYGHYLEPNLNFQISRENLIMNNGMIKLELVFNPFLNYGIWESVTGLNPYDQPIE